MKQKKIFIALIAMLVTMTVVSCSQDEGTLSSGSTASADSTSLPDLKIPTNKIFV